MSERSTTNKKIGIIGGGQLGKMLALEAGPMHFPIFALDKSVDFPAGPYVHEFTEGDFNNYDDVYQFGKDKDVVTIEIEHVNTEALLQLKKEGIKVHPNPESLNIIKDKGKQKQFYLSKGFPSSAFRLFSSSDSIKKAIEDKEISLPFVQKLCTEGYDGKGVKVVKSEDDLSDLLEGESLVEDLVDIDKELAVIVARNEAGETKSFTAVEMTFNPQANLVEYLLCPARVSEAIEEEAEKMAVDLINAFDICGLLAIEFFLTNDQKLLINEVAPRPHNSGHHTIDSCYTSQFEQHIRGILGLPLGSTKIKTPAVMLNLLGEANYTGPAFYEGLDKCLSMEGVKLHLYGKKITKPFRKMGHATVLADDLEKALEKANEVKNTLKIITT
jgi:5-(carboxyamino)imidazole ribonucleotide synthase